jgi:hypothetical protein
MENFSKRDQTTKHIMIVLVGMLVILFIAIVNLLLQLNLVQTLVVSWVLTTFYAAGAILVVDPRVNPVRIVEREVPVDVIREVFIDRPVIVEKEVIKEVPIQIPIENRTIQVVEKKVEVPVYREVRVPVYKDKIVFKNKYIERKRKKLNIPKYDFVGSTETKTYHNRNCRFSKLIKNKYKLHSNDKSTFVGKHFKRCKMCLNKKK